MTECTQASPEWFAVRCGKLTASRFAEAVARTRSGWGSGRKNLMAQLAAERLTGVVAESYSNTAMQWGNETEPEAGVAYEFYHDARVKVVGFIDHPQIAMTGASPDGLVGDDGLIEIKCPNTATHIDTLMGGNIPDKYIRQMHWQMICTKRRWCDFISYDPRMPEELKLYVQRFELDSDTAREMEGQAREFLAELEGMVKSLKAKFIIREEPVNVLMAG